ncbi:MAG TPA: XkdF-like putative serine protease domain-containing protein [Spirochaetota bacterium]|nr:XkdF-like putative serine protease domain-containing protein [Spirochaetota bacterium]
MTEKFMKDFDIDFISILTDNWKPKNGIIAVVKGSTNDIKITNIEVQKGDDGKAIKGLLFATVVEQGIIDKDGHQIENEQVEKSCHNYMNKIIEKGINEPSDNNHDHKVLKGVKLAENYVDRSTDNYSHKVVLDFSGNAELMEKAVTTGINGISPSGRVNIVEKGAFERAFDKITSIFKGTNFEKELEKINKGEPDMKKELQDFVNTDEGKKELETLGYVQKAAPETSQETSEKKEPEKAPETISKADFDAYKADQEKKIADLTKTLTDVAKARQSGSDELPPNTDVNLMTEDQLKTLRETKPEIYQAVMKAELEKRKNKR